MICIAERFNSCVTSMPLESLPVNARQARPTVVTATVSKLGGSDRLFYIARVFSDQESAIVAVIQIYGRTARLNRQGQLSAPHLVRSLPLTIRHSAFVMARRNRVPNLQARIDR